MTHASSVSWQASILLIALSSSVLVHGAWPARADAAPVTLVRAEPVSADGTTFLAALEAAHEAGEPDRFKIKGDLWFLNGGSDDLEVSAVDIGYPGSSVPGVSTTPTTSEVLKPGVEGRVRVFDGLFRELPVPLPPSIEITVRFSGTSKTVELSYALDFYRNDTATGGQLFPALAADLGPGEYWSYGTRHIDDATGSQQPSTVRDRYAYDFVVVRWDGGSYTTRGVDEAGNTLPGTENNHDLSFGKPLYAVADGVIVLCSRGNRDSTRPGVEDAAINELWIQYGDELVRLAHLQADSIPERLCPNGDGAQHYVEHEGITVDAGERVGNVGNNGQSSGPHLHMSAHYRPDRTRLPDVSFEGADSRPQGFHNVRIASDDETTDNLGPSPSFRPINGPTVPSNTLIVPNPCGLELPAGGSVELSRHGIPSECYQDRFNLDVQAGYRPVFVDGYDVAGAVEFNVVYRSGGKTPVATVASHGLDGTEFQEQFDDLTNDGYRLHHIDSYLDGVTIRYAAIFELRDGVPWAAYHGLNTVQHAAEVEILRADGFVPVRVAATHPGDASGPRWSAIFEQHAVGSWDIVDASASSYQSAFDAQLGAGRLPTHVHGHRGTGGARLVGVFVEPIGGATSATHGLDSAGHQSAFDTALASGQLTRAVAGYDDGGRRFAAVWRSVVDSAFTATPPAFTNNTSATLSFVADDPFASFGCRLDAAVTFTSCTSPAKASGLAEGGHTFAVRPVDRDGVVDPSPSITSWVVDLTAPTVAITRPEHGYTYAHDKPSPRDDGNIHVVGHMTVVATASDGVSGIDSVLFRINGVEVPPASISHIPGSDTWTFRFEPSEQGKSTYTLEWSASDGAGNTAMTSVDVTGVRKK